MAVTYQTDDSEWIIGVDMTRSDIYKNEQREKPTATVMRMGALRLNGNVIPHTWRDHLRRKNKRATAKTVVDLEATVALAWIAFWYRPAEILDEKTSTVLGWKKKFWGDKLQASYEHIANETGLSKRQAKEALDRLEAKIPETPKDPDGYAVITREFRHSRAGSNVLYIDINVDRFIEISFPKDVVATILRNCGGSSYAIAGDDVSQLRDTYTENTITEKTNREEELPASQAQPRKFASAIDPDLHDELLVALNPLSLQDELMTLNGTAPTVSPRTEKKERKPREPKVTTLAPNANNYHREMFTALATLCKVDPKLKRGQLNAASKRLREAGYDPASLDKFANWWYSQDFRGQQGKPPSIGQVEELILQATQWVPWTPPAVPAKKNGPSLDALRSWHYQYCYEQWNDHIAADLGYANPNMPGVFKEWYDNEARIPDDQLTDWYDWYLNRNKEMNQW